MRFDDVRLMEVSAPTSGSLAAQAEGYLYYEDFERVPFGWGPFMLSRPSNCTSHLSERHDPYTAGDVINGDWSFKTLNEGGGEILRTMPSLLSFSPNTGYAVEFEYDAPVAGVYRGVVRSAKTGRTLVSGPRAGRRGPFRGGVRDRRGGRLLFFRCQGRGRDAGDRRFRRAENRKIISAVRGGVGERRPHCGDIVTIRLKYKFPR